MKKEIGINWQSDFSSDDRDVIEEDVHAHVGRMVRGGYKQGQLTSGGTEPSYLGWWKVSIEEDDNDEDIRNEEVASKIQDGYTSGHYPTFTFSANIWSEEFKTGGTTNRNWFQKAIAETGTLNLGGWKKTMPRAERRLRAYSSHKNASNTVHDASLSTARALQALANVTQDADTKKKAKSDADYFFKQAKDSKRKKVGMKSRGGVYNEGGTTSVSYDIYDDGELEKQSITEREVIDFANTVSHYERTDNDEPEATNYSDALAILNSLGYTVKERFSNGGTTSSAWTKFKKWLGEEI